MMRELFKTILVVIALFTINAGFGQQWNGLTLYSNSNSNLGYLIDTNSTVVKTWTFTGNTGYSTHMMPGGDIFRTVVNNGNTLTGGGITGRIQKVSYAGTVLWDYVYSSSTYCLHHDHCPLPNGNVLVISYDVKTPTQVTAAGASTSITVWSEKILELKPVGTNSAVVVWEWDLWDHLVQNVNPNAANYQSSIVNNPQLLNINYNLAKDWIHMNGIDYNPLLDQIAFSSHFLNQWFIIDHSTTTTEAASHSGGNAGKGGDFLYRYGNPTSYGATGSTALNVTHDVHWVPEGSPFAGDLAGINNMAVTSPSNKSAVDRVSVPRVDLNYTITPGSAFTPTTYTARHLSTGYTSNMGSSDQFSNGNQMVCLATAGTIYEIDAAGNTIWTKSTGGATPQAHRYTSCYINNAAPSQPTITSNGTDLVSTAASSYQWYLNGNVISGATSQTYTPSQAGIYVVKTTDANGCVYVYSQGFSYGISTGISTKNNTSSVDLFPNPTTDGIKISVDAKDIQGMKIIVYDNSGKELMNVANDNTADLSELPTGLYLVTVLVPGSTPAYKKVSLIK